MRLRINRNLSERHFHQNRVMVGVDKAVILRFQQIHAQIRRNDKAVDHIILKALVIRAGVGLIERTAGRHARAERRSDTRFQRNAENG